MTETSISRSALSPKKSEIDALNRMGYAWDKMTTDYFKLKKSVPTVDVGELYLEYNVETLCW